MSPAASQFVYVILAVDKHGLGNKARYCMVRERQCCIAVHFTVAIRHLTSCTLLTRQSTKVLKVGMPCRL